MVVTWVVESPSLIYYVPPNAGQSTSSHPTVTMQDTMHPVLSARHHPTVSCVGYLM